VTAAFVTELALPRQASRCFAWGILSSKEFSTSIRIAIYPQWAPGNFVSLEYFEVIW